ncbi:MAG TPA: hypothetical protein VGD49_09010 [Longimicrobiales bacterium]
MRFTLLLLTAAFLSGCRRNPEDNAVSDPSPPPAAALSGQQQSLDAGLRTLDTELSEAMRGDLDGDGAKNHLLRAEAITDRLLESDLPFHWLRARDYSVESMVRQIQALADRVIAKMRNGLDGQDLLPDVRELRQTVIQLRRALAMGGGPAPVSLDSLLARYANDSTVVTDVGE